MCGRYTNTVGPEEIRERLGVAIASDAGTGRFNIAPTEEVLAIVAPHGEPQPRMLRWGLVRPWMRDRRRAYNMINARLETVTRTPAYRDLVPTARRRALQVADGWYEWLKAERPREPRQPFHFRVDGGVPFAFAALWAPAPAEAGDSAGAWIESVALLTCDASANDVARAVHDRMPVVLADLDAQRAWLDPDVGTDEALALCGPLPSERLSVSAANPAVNKPGIEGPDLLLAPAPGRPA